MDFLAKLKEWIASLDSDDSADGIGEPDLDGNADNAPDSPGTDQDALRNEDGPTDNADDTADGATGGDSDAADDEDDEADETAPEAEVDADVLRNSINKISAENERLRVLLTDAGIDFEVDEEVPDGDESPEDADDEYDDEAATADIAAVKARNAEWEK